MRDDDGKAAEGRSCNVDWGALATSEEEVEGEE